MNVDPLPITQEISKEEKEHDRVAGDYASEKKISLLTVMEKKQKKIHALMQGQTIPFHAMFAIRVWDKTRDGLNAKAGAIKNAINSMNAAQYFESNLPSTSKNLFFQTWPGWTWGRYEHRKLYSEHRFLADMLPVTSTFTGHLATAEAIYDGPHNNLVGIETFSGSARTTSRRNTPCCSACRARANPSPFATCLRRPKAISVTPSSSRKGFRYGIYTATVEEGARPIIIHPDGDLTINYLDTKGLPLTPDHLSAATALVARMIGTIAQEDKQMLRQAQIAKYLNLLYEDAFQDWQKKRHDQLLDIARHALALQKFRGGTDAARRDHASKLLRTSATGRRAHADEAEAYLAAVRRSRGVEVPERPEDQQGSPQSRLRLLHAGRVPDASDASGIDDARPDGRGARPDHGNRHAHPAVVSRRQLRLPVRRHEQSFAHRQNRALRVGLHPGIGEGIEGRGRFPHHQPRAQAHHDAAARDCGNGTSTRKSPASSTFPAARKSFRKATPSFASSIAGTSPSCSSMRASSSRASAPPCSATRRQFFIMRQNDRADLDDMGKDIALPEVTQHAIMNYPLPDHQTGQKYSPFTYLHTDSTRNICGTVHNVASPEMLYCSSVQRRTFRPPRPRTSPESERRRGNHPSRQSPQPTTKPKPLTRYENQTHSSTHSNTASAPLVVGLFAGCAATRPISDVALGAGGAYLGNELSHGNPIATAAGAAGGVIVSEGLHYAAKKQAEKAYADRLRQGQERRREAAVLALRLHAAASATRSATSAFTPCNCRNSGLTG